MFYRTKSNILCIAVFLIACTGRMLAEQVGNWQMQDVAKVPAAAESVSKLSFKPDHWYKATVPGTVLTTLVDNKVYPEPLYGENMRAIPESLNKTKYWYRTTLPIPTTYKGRHVWLRFAGINYSAEVWVNGARAGSMLGAFVRGDFDITPYVKPGTSAAIAVLVSPQPHPGIPHEHTVANGVGKNGGETALDGATFLSTIGWDWLPAIRDRDTGIWLPVTLDATGPVLVNDTFVSTDLSPTHKTADLKVQATLENLSANEEKGTLVGVISGQGPDVTFSRPISIPAHGSTPVSLDGTSIPELHVNDPKLWWPNGYGPQNLYKLTLRFDIGKNTSQRIDTSFGIRKIEYSVPDSDFLTISVNGVKIMVRGGDWGLDEAMKRVSYERLDAQFHMHALANLNMIRNWVGQSTSPEFYELADKYGMLLWDEFFQPNPGDGPNVADIPPYLANVKDKVLRYRNHPSIAVWCARNEGYPPRELDDQLKAMMTSLDPTRTYQSNSADGRGVSSHGPYYWRSPRFFYALNEAFKTETGSVSVPTIESIQGMMPKKDWETINDDWAQHDMAKGAQRGDEYPFTLAKRYGPIRNLADFVRKAQLANYEAFRAMYEGRNAEMFRQTTGILTWMSHPAQPSFVWQLYHYDLDPNASLYGAKKASETIHIQLNEALRGIELVNNTPDALDNLKVRVTSYRLDGAVGGVKEYTVARLPGSSTIKAAQLDVSTAISAVYFLKFDLLDASNKLLSTNFYWQNVAQDDFAALQQMPRTRLTITASKRLVGSNVVIDAKLTNPTSAIALMTHLQLHRSDTGERVLPAFYSDNYISLAPGESRDITIEAPESHVDLSQALIEVDGFNVDVEPVEGLVIANRNADPSLSPATSIVPSTLP